MNTLLPLTLASLPLAPRIGLVILMFSAFVFIWTIFSIPVHFDDAPKKRNKRHTR